MQPSAGRLRPILPKPASVGQGSLRNDNPPMQGNEGVLTFRLPEHFNDLRQCEYVLGDILSPPIVNSASMQSTTGSSRPILPKPADVGQGSLRNDKPTVQSNECELIFNLPEHFNDLRQPEYSLCNIPSPPRVVNFRSMQPSAHPLRPRLPKPANVRQVSLKNDNAPRQSNDGVLRFSLILTPEDFPDLREPADDIRTTGSSANSRGNDLDRVCYTRPANGSLRCRFCQAISPSKRSLLAHLRKHSQDASRETDLLLEKLASSLRALGYEIDVVASTTPYGQKRSNVTLGQALDRQWPGTQPSSCMPVQTVQETPVVSSSNNAGAPPGNPSSSLEQLNNPPALPFSLKPVFDLDALEQVVKQEKDAVLMSCNLAVAEGGRQDGASNENAGEPPSAQCVVDATSGGDLVIDKSPDPASGAELVTNGCPGHLSKEHMPNNAELPPSTPSAVHAKGVQRKRRIYGDHVANDAKATRRSERFHESSLGKAESAAPSSITEPDYVRATSRPKRIRATTRHPPQYDPSDKGAPSQNAPKGAACQKSAQGAYKSLCSAYS